MFAKLLSFKPKQDIVQQKRTAIYRSMLRREAQMGGQLFGPLPKGTKREFFCLDDATWVWHEEYIDQNGRKQIRNTRYDIRPTGILKAQNGQSYHMVSMQEAEHLRGAIHTYVGHATQTMYQNAV